MAGHLEVAAGVTLSKRDVGAPVFVHDIVAFGAFGVTAVPLVVLVDELELGTVLNALDSNREAAIGALSHLLLAVSPVGERAGNVPSGFGGSGLFHHTLHTTGVVVTAGLPGKVTTRVAVVTVVADDEVGGSCRGSVKQVHVVTVVLSHRRGVHVGLAGPVTIVITAPSVHVDTAGTPVVGVFDVNEVFALLPGAEVGHHKLGCVVTFLARDVDHAGRGVELDGVHTHGGDGHLGTVVNTCHKREVLTERHRVPLTAKTIRLNSIPIVSGTCQLCGQCEILLAGRCHIQVERVVVATNQRELFTLISNPTIL